MSEKPKETRLFQRGGPGGPGRPRRIPKWVAEFRRMEPKVFAFLKQMIEDVNAEPRDRMEAAKLALAYSRGKPRQSVEMTGADGGPIQHSVTGVLRAPPAKTPEEWDAEAQRATGKSGEPTK